MPARGFVSRDAHACCARSCSACAGPAIAGSGTADRRAGPRRARSRSGRREPATKGLPRAGSITVIASKTAATARPSLGA
jgi:hypothetical protein